MFKRIFKKEEKKKKYTRLFFATDVHGSEICFRKFINCGNFYKADILVLGGDITGKMVVPITEKPDGTFEARYLGKECVARSKEELESLQKDIRDGGFYYCLVSPNERKELEASKAKADKLFLNLIIERLKAWIKLAEEHLGPTGVKCYITGGNDDLEDIEPILNSSRYIINPEGKVVRIDEYHEMISSGYANVTPWNCPRDIPDEKLAKKLETMASKVENMNNCIFNLHAPPYDSGLDLAPKLDKDLRPVLKGGTPFEIPVGSTAVSSCIIKYQPLLGLHGHIHEAKGNIKIGRTLCVNPGSQYSTGVLMGALIDFDEEKIKNCMLTSG